MDSSPVRELSVAPRPLKELGRGRPKSYGQRLVINFVEELWSIPSGLLQLHTAFTRKLPQISV